MRIVIDCIDKYVTSVVLQYAYVRKRGDLGEYIWRHSHKVAGVSHTRQSECIEVVPLRLEDLQRPEAAFLKKSTDQRQILRGPSAQDLPHLVRRFVSVIDVVPLNGMHAFRRRFLTVCLDRLNSLSLFIKFSLWIFFKVLSNGCQSVDSLSTE